MRFVNFNLFTINLKNLIKRLEECYGHGHKYKYVSWRKQILYWKYNLLRGAKLTKSQFLVIKVRIKTKTCNVVMTMLSINLGYLIWFKPVRVKTKQLMMILNIKTNQQFLSGSKQIYEQTVQLCSSSGLSVSARNFVTVLWVSANLKIVLVWQQQQPIGSEIWPGLCPVPTDQ